jgi:DNA-binding CsgD family transcriptional regulator/cell division protein FtsL
MQANYRLRAVLLCLLLFSLHIFASTNDAKIAVYEKIMSDESLSIDDRIQRADSILLISNDLEKRKKTLMTKASILYDAERYRSSAEVYSQLTGKDYKLTPSEYCLTQYKIISSEINSGDYRDAFPRSLDLIYYAKPDSLKYYNVLAEISRYKIFLKYNYTTFAKNEMSDLEDEIKNLKVKESARNEIMYQWLTFKSGLYIELKDWDKLFESINQARKYAKGKFKNEIVETYNAILYEGLDQKEITKKIYQKILAENPTDGVRCMVIVNYCYTLMDEGKFSEVLQLLKDNQQYIDRTEMEHIRAVFYNLRGEAYECLGDYANALQDRKISDNISGAIFNGTNQEFMKLMMENETKVLNATRLELERQNYQKMLLISVLLLVVVILSVVGVWLRRYYRNRNRDAEKLSRELSHQIEIKDEEHQREVEESSQTLEERDRELASMTLKMAQVDKSVKTIASAVNDDNLPENERMKKISSAIKDLDLHDNIWEMVRITFERTRQSFFTELYRKHPDLTQSEIRMCAYILMNISTKEIAMLTNRSLRTVEATKYNLRKKLQLTDETTENYLRRLAAETSS